MTDTKDQCPAALGQRLLDAVKEQEIAPKGAIKVVAVDKKRGRVLLEWEAG